MGVIMYIEEVFDFNLVERVTDTIKSNKRCCLYYSPTQTTAFVGYKNNIDAEQAQQYDVKVLKLNNEGGVIISDKGSLIIGAFFDEANDFQQTLAYNICRKIIEKGYKAEISGNDIIVEDEFKVASFSSRRFGKTLFGSFQISFTVNIELIKSLCTKPMRKIPRGLNYYNIYFDEIFLIFLNTLNNFS